MSQNNRPHPVARPDQPSLLATVPDSNDSEPGVRSTEIDSGIQNDAEFDRYAAEYSAMHAASIRISGEGPEYFAEYKIKDIARTCGSDFDATNKTCKVLDFGAGTGGSIPHFQKHVHGVELTCLDVSSRSLEIAEKRYASLAQYKHFDGVHIPFPEGYFDIAYASCVFHHIDHAQHVSLLRELHRVICPGGRLFVFEHNPYNPVTVRVVNNCPFDENAELIRASAMKRSLTLAGFSTVTVRYKVFFPHFMRALRPLEAALAWLPLGGQYSALAQK